MMRAIVVGTSGAGKSTFARALAQVEGCRYVELDELWWAPNWTPRHPDTFRALVAQAASGERWVIDGNYSVARSVLWPRATHVVWLNFDRFTVFSRVLARTVRRAATRERLWAGNRESFAKSFFSKDSILLWSLSTYARNRVKYAALRDDAKFAHLQWHEFTSPAEAARFLRSRGAAIGEDVAP